MNIEIYQIEMALDKNRVCFARHDDIEKIQGNKNIDSTIYRKVFDGEVTADNLEGVYEIFNINKPSGYMGRSLSVSDIVAVKDEKTSFYFCDSVGFKEVDFDTSQVIKETIKVVFCEPGKMATIAEIGTELTSLQKAVDGMIEAYYPFEDTACIICNECGKIYGMELNRGIKQEGELIDIIAGPFFICDASGENLGSLSPEQVDKYMNKFKYPEIFYKTEKGIVSVPYKPEIEHVR